MSSQLKIEGNPFYDATRSVFQSMLDLDVTRMEGGKNPGGEEAVKVEIAFIGDLSGTVVYCFPKSTTLNIVKTMSGMEADQVDDFATSMLGEMANIISGNAVSALSGQDCSCDIKPPRITVDAAGQDESGNSMDLFLHSPAGELQENIHLTQNH